MIKGNKQQIYVIGDLMLDEYWNCESNRISPEAPVPIMQVKSIESRLGGAGNVARNLASLEVETILIGYIADDAVGKEIQYLVNSQNKINPIFVFGKKHPSTKKLRIISRNKHVLRVDQEEILTEDYFCPEQLEIKPNEGDIIIFSDYNKGFIGDISPYLKEFRKQGIFVAVDPKGEDFSKYMYASLITPNEKEFQAIVGVCTNENQVTEKAFGLIDSLKLEALLLTRGEKGLSLFFNNSKFDFSATAKEVMDVTGAGDTVIASFIYMFIQSKDLIKSAEFSNKCAGIVVSKFGTSHLNLTDINF